MAAHNIIQLIEQTFAKSKKTDWSKVAQKELGEKKNIQSLSWTIDSLELSPYYDESDVTDLRYLEDYQDLRNEGKPGWQNTPEIFVKNEFEANKEALQLLQSGADGILFNTSELSSVNIDLLLKNIQAEICSLSFITSDTKLATNFLVYARENGYDVSKLNGAFFYGHETSNKKIETLPGFLKNGIVVRQSSPVNEIAHALTTATSYMDTLQYDREAERCFRSLAVLVYSEENFMMTIAKLKAIRILWSQLSMAFGISDYLPAELHLHARSNANIDDNFNPHAVMISNTVDALAAVMGGCSALTLNTVEGDDLSRRIALNVSHLLKDESHIDKVLDPLAGAYSIEKMTHELSAAAWHLFQYNIKS